MSLVPTGLTDTAAPEDESYEDKLTIARLESELAEIIQYAFSFTDGATLTSRREELLASLTKEQDSIIKTKKEIKQRFDAVDTYLSDYSKVSSVNPYGMVKLIPDHKCGFEKDQGCRRVHIHIDSREH